MKKVVFFIESFGGGGAEKVLLNILRNIDYHKFEVTVIVMADTGPLSDAMHSLPVKIFPVVGKSLWGRIKYKLLYSVLPPKLACRWITKGITTDTYVAFTEGYCTKIFSFLSSSSRKIAWVHIDLKTFPWPLQLSIFRNLNEERLSYTKFDEVVGVSKQVSRIMLDYYGIRNVKTIYNPIDEKSIRDLSTLQSGIETFKDDFNIVSVGRLTTQKGFNHLIDIVGTLSKHHKNIKLYILGEGEERKALQEQIHGLGLTELVEMPGFVSNPAAIVKQMDLFVCSSIAEGFSLVIAEALTLGIPVISMDCAGPRELLGDGKFGSICQSYDQLRQEMEKAIEDKNYLSQLKQKASLPNPAISSSNSIRQIEQLLSGENYA